MKKSIIFGRVDEVKEGVKNPRLIAKRVGEIEVSNKNKSAKSKKISINDKHLNYNHHKHL